MEKWFYMEIQGQVERITFHNEENGYTIARMKVPGNRELITIVGNLLSITPGEILKLQGCLLYTSRCV